MKRIVVAWALLVIASAATTAFAFTHAKGPLVAAALLLLALIKSRVILSNYLRLSEAPAIRRGFMAVLVLWAGVAMALYFAAQQ